MNQSSLFDPASPMPLSSSAQWLEGMLLGQVAVTLCMVAVAVVGLVMLSGRLPVRRGMWTVLGCFVLLGAPVIAEVFIDHGRSDVPVRVAAAPTEHPDFEAREELPPSRVSPYSRASTTSNN